jgi:uncharacterized protein YbcC (UPF0753/DUF2309 family)
LPISAFIGHGSHSANNPFGSSLDCGACAASPGRHNARCSAKIANIPEVRQALKENHNIEIPASTILLEENTIPLQMILLFDSEFQTLIKTIAKVEIKFAKNTTNGNSRKAGCCNNSVVLIKNRITEKLDLSGAWQNAGFIVGSRELTKSNNLDGRCFYILIIGKKIKAGKHLKPSCKAPWW